MFAISTAQVVLKNVFRQVVAGTLALSCLAVGGLVTPIVTPIITPVEAASLPVMRISTENADTHVQTMAVKRFADDLAEKLNGKIDVKFYGRARLFRDRDVVEALSRGRGEMAVPGTWHVTMHEPNVGLFLLPEFYGRPASDNYKVLSSEVGKELNNRIERMAGVKVLGDWIDLGHAHLFGVRHTIADHDDIMGLRVRVAGGRANELRLNAMGAESISIAWPDLIERMKTGNVDAILTTHETIRSARLWEHNVVSVFEDYEYFPQYVPLVSRSFWNRLPDDIRMIISKTWQDHVEEAREDARKAQELARSENMSHGVEIYKADEGELELWRNKLRKEQPAIMEAIGVDPELMTRVTEVLRQ